MAIKELIDNIWLEMHIMAVLNDSRNQLAWSFAYSQRMMIDFIFKLTYY